MIINKKSIKISFTHIIICLSLLSFGLFRSAYAYLTPPKSLKSAVSGTRTDVPARNGEFLCIPGVPSNTTIEQTDNFWMHGITLVVSEYESVEVEGNFSNGTSIFNTILTNKERRFVGNGIPNHRTGRFPVQPGTAAYSYYASVPATGYPNAAAIPIEPYNLDVTVPRDPVYSETPYCMNSIVFGIATQTGARWDVNLAAGY